VCVWCVCGVCVCGVFSLCVVCVCGVFSLCVVCVFVLWVVCVWCVWCVCVASTRIRLRQLYSNAWFGVSWHWKTFQSVGKWRCRISNGLTRVLLNAHATVNLPLYCISYLEIPSFVLQHYSRGTVSYHSHTTHNFPSSSRASSKVSATEHLFRIPDIESRLNYMFEWLIRTARAAFSARTPDILILRGFP
jgi:hypothetical protein